MELTRTDIEKLERKYRLNLINSISGIKPSNLIGTRSKDGIDNVAIFSSVVHIGSSPAQLAFIARPHSDTPRNTLVNIEETGFFTINHVSKSFIEKAHYTSAKLPNTESEFDTMKLGREFIGDFHAPFVKESLVKIGMTLAENVQLPNGCTFVIGNVESIHAPNSSVNDLGQLNLEDYDGTGISGLNSYYGLTKLDTFPYVRENEIPDFQ